MTNIHDVAVIGGGTMGCGIAETFAKNGFNVAVIEKSQADVARVELAIDLSLKKQLEKWRITEAEKKITLSHLEVTTDFERVKNVDLVIESVYEDFVTKKEVLQRCDRLARPGVIFASNTSALSLTELAAATERPDKVIGLHFLYPVGTRNLVEIVRALKTSDETVAAAKEIVDQLAKVSVEVYESPGFVTTRLMMTVINEALRVLMEGVATAREIDIAMKLGYDFQYGPLEAADRFGLDAVLAAMEHLYREFGEPKYRPAPLLKKMVRANQLGVKTGEGFFRYNEDGERILEEETGQ
ncbi:3-hydroxyacyl-CoA dehydrogenase family protein [Numidum massiliense]|uniref:3-hydroxyacyl-CoA dehydrogenase family protein n=1 Tax=Numidum massiliense TaxID=1522315 RepID=UPI0006D590E9|nr:3-hydroxyacyl-CoA dehydrogenase NAD-binding domain-containing protein [Numidum massiliense]